MTIAQIVGDGGATLTFRVSVVVGLVTLATFMWRLLAALKEKAKLEQRVETHLSQTEPLIAQFQIMQRAISSGEERHQAMTDRLDRFISQQDEMNRHFRDNIDNLFRRGDNPKEAR
jgi:hypothetical protein